MPIEVDKDINILYNKIMQTIICHSLVKQQFQFGLLAYWSVFANGNSDRTPEIKSGFQEGASY